jgi:hypothetical protein
MNGATSIISGSKVVFTEMTMIDNIMGFGPNLGGGGYTDKYTEVKDCKIYGETAAPDCPPNGGYCKKSSKFGLNSCRVLGGAKDSHPTTLSALPFHSKHVGASMWGSNNIFNRVTFYNFTAKTRYG